MSTEPLTASQADWINTFGQLVTAVTKLTDVVGPALRGLTLNDILETSLVTLDANGQAERSYSVPYASVIVANHGPVDVLVGATTLQLGRPGDGKTMFAVGAGRWACRPLTGPTLALYGRPGARVGITVLLSVAPPSGGDVDDRPIGAYALPAVSGVVGPTGTDTFGGVRYHGFTARESSGIAPATFEIRVGTATGEILETVSLSPAESRAELYATGIGSADDLFVVIATGAVSGSLRVA